MCNLKIKNKIKGLLQNKNWSRSSFQKRIETLQFPVRIFLKKKKVIENLYWRE